MKKPLTVSSLSDLLKEKTKEDKETIEESTRQQLKTHVDDLKQLSADALNTTKAVMDASNRHLNQTLSDYEQALNTMTEKLEETNRKQLNRLLWLTRVPVLMTLSLFLIVCGVSWEYWKSQQAMETMTTTDGKKWQVMRPQNGWRLCQNLTPPRPCRLLDSSTN